MNRRFPPGAAALLLCCLMAMIGFSASACEKLENCKWECSQGIIDLNPLSSKDEHKPRWLDAQSTGDDYTYSYNPCQGFKETAPTGGTAQVDDCNQPEPVVACQIGQATWVRKHTISTTVGQNTEQFQEVGNGNVTVHYTGSGSASPTERRTIVILTCADSEKFEAVGQAGQDPIYIFKLSSPHCCPKSAGLSVGSVLCIIFFVLLFAYIICGMLFMKLRRQATGVDICPNLVFWKELPAYTKEGVVFTIQGCKAGIGRATGKQYTSI